MRLADAEREGELRARQLPSADLLRQVTRAAKRKHDADTEYEQAVTRAGRLGLSHREIATAAQISHGTIRASLTRASTITDNWGVLLELCCAPSTPCLRRSAFHAAAPARVR